MKEKVLGDLSFSKYVLGPFEGKEGDYEIDDEMYDTEGMFDDYMGLDGKQDDEGMLDNADNVKDNNSELWILEITFWISRALWFQIHQLKTSVKFFFSSAV